MKFAAITPLVLILALSSISQSAHIDYACPTCKGKGRVQHIPQTMTEHTEQAQIQKYNPALDVPVQPSTLCCTYHGIQCPPEVDAEWYVKQKIGMKSKDAREQCCCSKMFLQDSMGICEPKGPLVSSGCNGRGASLLS